MMEEDINRITLKYFNSDLSTTPFPASEIFFDMGMLIGICSRYSTKILELENTIAELHDEINNLSGGTLVQ